MKTDFHTRHSLGQNFLIDRNILNFIVERSGACDVILEIGPGQGVLTQALLERDSVRCVHAIEFDERLRPVLEPVAQRDSRLRLHWGDVMKLDLSQLSPFPTRAIANIPYNITTPLIWKLLPLVPLGLKYYFFMVQREAADRLTAPADTKARYPLGVALEVMGHVTRVKSVPATCFRPMPRVESALIEIILDDQSPVAPEDFWLWKDLLHCGFSQRRKTLLNNFKNFLDLPQSTWERILIEALPTGPKTRAEDLTGSEWLALLRCVKQLP